MSIEQLKKYLPDEPKEISFLGSSLVRLSSMISAGLVISKAGLWPLVTIGLAWAGYEIQEYFKLHQKKKVNPRDNGKP